MNQDHGIIKSPGYPGRYPADRNCFWTITVEPGNVIQLLFGSISIESTSKCNKDFLEVRSRTSDFCFVSNYFSGRLFCKYRDSDTWLLALLLSANVGCGQYIILCVIDLLSVICVVISLGVDLQVVPDSSIWNVCYVILIDRFEMEF